MDRFNHGGAASFRCCRGEAERWKEKLKAEILETRQRMQLNEEEFRENELKLNSLLELLRIATQEGACNPSSNGIVDDGNYSERISRLIVNRSLPEKGKLVEAVHDAGRYLQTELFLARTPLPQWKIPPPLEQHHQNQTRNRLTILSGYLETIGFLKGKLQETTSQLQMLRENAEGEKSKLVQLLQNAVQERDEARERCGILRQRFKHIAESSNYVLVPAQLLSMPASQGLSKVTNSVARNTQLLPLFQDPPVPRVLKRERE